MALWVTEQSEFSVCFELYWLSFVYLVRKFIFDSSKQGNGEGNGTPLQYSCLETPMDVGAWWAAVQGVLESWTWLSDFTFTFHFHALEKEMATHSSVLAWRIPGMREPGGLPSMGWHRVRYDWSDLTNKASSIEDNLLKTRIHLFNLYYLNTLGLNSGSS